MNIKTLKLQIDGMNCEHCIAAVENSLKELDGIISATASLQDNQALVEYEPDKVSSMHMIVATTNAGYPSTIE